MLGRHKVLGLIPSTMKEVITKMIQEKIVRNHAVKIYMAQKGFPRVSALCTRASEVFTLQGSQTAMPKPWQRALMVVLQPD